MASNALIRQDFHVVLRFADENQQTGAATGAVQALLQKRLPGQAGGTHPLQATGHDPELHRLEAEQYRQHQQDAPLQQQGFKGRQPDRQE